jgi:peptidoglycan/xylan/chitin deacetylase (PgdA/CDA1 family)
MMKLRIFLCFAFAALFFFPAAGMAKTGFSGLDLAGDDRLLFRGDSENARGTLFLSRLEDRSIRQLTAFPEKMELVEDGKTLQVRNAFGVVRIPLSGGLPGAVPGFPSFASGSAVLGGRLEETAVSGDGKWLLYVEPVSAAYGNLVLLDTVSGIRTQIAVRVERPDALFPACWSPDSRMFVYSRGRKLYYYTVGPLASPVDERYRLIGEGTIKSVQWGRAGDFFYLRNSTVYRIHRAELFTRVLYADFLELGSVAGRLPWNFDPEFDSFRIGPDAASLLLTKGRSVFYVALETETGEDPGRGQDSLPYMTLPRSASSFDLLWSPAGTLTLIVSLSGKNGAEAAAYRLVPDGKGLVFSALTPPPAFNAALSPDGTRALFWGRGGIVLWDYEGWRALNTLSSRPAHSCLWVGNNECITGDEEKIERLRLSDGSRSLLCLSGAEESAFNEGESRILAKNGGRWFDTDGRDPWTETAVPAPRPPSLVSSQFRVYLEKQHFGPYETIPMIRNIASTGTVPLFSPVEYARAVPAAPSSGGTPGLFSHGPRGGLREVALCFDLYDDAEGLPAVLGALNRFGIRATFFLNGEFIRRHPLSAKDIVDAGHEAASLFFAPLDLSDSRYRIGGDFIARGLARNEDEFFRAAGAELALLWHPPYYAASPEIIAAAAAAGYVSAGRDTDPMDWLSRDEARRLGVFQYSASDMIDRIMELKQPGSIIPLRLGLLAGGRDDYLFNRLEVLLDALVRGGYSVVPVSVLIEHSK